MNLLKKNLAIILILFLALFIRLYTVWDNNVFFYYDQARDATIVTQMISNYDLKLQGPSVSGTNDSVYHGVLYYYVIAPLYFIFNGNPTSVVVVLSIFSLFGIYITYLLGSKVFDSKKVGLLASFLQALSLFSVQQSTWLSNPNLSAITIPAVYLFTWKIFLNKEQSKLNFILWGVSIATSIQVALQSVTLLGGIFLIVLFSLYKKYFKLNKKSFILIGLSIFTVLVGISSMFLTQFLMYKRGILSVDSLHLSQHQITFFQALSKSLFSYLNELSFMLALKFNRIIIFIITATIMLLSKINNKQFVWWISFFTAPLWLLLWHFRDPHHTFIGLEVLVFLLISKGIIHIFSSKTLPIKIVPVLFLLIFIIVNIQQIKFSRENEINNFGIQRGAFLERQLTLIDTTYTNSEGDFSFSSLTAPFNINTTWDYLYKWYGQNTYGYVPKFLGIRQAGFVTNEVLPQTNFPINPHMLIMEPDTTLSDEYME